MKDYYLWLPAENSGRTSWINPAVVLSRAVFWLRNCFLPLAGLTLAGQVPSLLAGFGGFGGFGGIGAGFIGAFIRLARGAPQFRSWFGAAWGRIWIGRPGSGLSGP